MQKVCRSRCETRRKAWTTCLGLLITSTCQGVPVPLSCCQDKYFVGGKVARPTSRATADPWNGMYRTPPVFDPALLQVLPYIFCASSLQLIGLAVAENLTLDFCWSYRGRSAVLHKLADKLSVFSPSIGRRGRGGVSISPAYAVVDPIGEKFFIQQYCPI